jgi:Sigma-70, region 4
MVATGPADPAAIVAAREGLRRALIASLQYLPPRQRAVLVLRDVLEFPAAEVAVMLGTTTVSVKSALQRARARMEELAPAADQIIEPTALQARDLLDQYIAAFENANAAALGRLLVRDAVLEATPDAHLVRRRQDLRALPPRPRHRPTRHLARVPHQRERPARRGGIRPRRAGRLTPSSQDSPDRSWQNQVSRPA